MTSLTALKLQQSAATAVPGCWTLNPGRAMTLQPRQAGVLRVSGGQVWATLDGPHAGPANDWGDLFLVEGEHLDLRRGQRLVIEPTANSADHLSAPACVEWEPSLQF